MINKKKKKHDDIVLLAKFKLKLFMASVISDDYLF